MRWISLDSTWASRTQLGGVLQWISELSTMDTQSRGVVIEVAELREWSSSRGSH